MVISKSDNWPTVCKIMVNGTKIEQVPQYKYLGSWITEDGRCDLEIKSRIGMARTTQRKYSLRVKKRILHCYVFLVLRYISK